MPEKILQANLEALGIERLGYHDSQEWSEFGGVEFPTYIITDDNFREKAAKALGLDTATAEDLKKGADSTDAGDTHGQYHNEAAWYETQRLEIQTKVADSLKNGLDRAVVVPDYEVVRRAVLDSGVDPSQQVTLGSKVLLQYGGDPSDTEEITMVSKLDSNGHSGWVSIETPLARAIEGKVKGEGVSFKPSDQPTVNTPTIEVKILDIL